MNQSEDLKAKLGAFWGRVVRFLEAASAQRHIVALRDGMIGSVPVILVGSTFLLLGSQGALMEDYAPGLAASDFGQWYLKSVEVILLPFRYTMGMLSLYVSFTIAAALAKQYDLPQIPSGLTAVATFLVAGNLKKGLIGEPGQLLPATVKAGKFLDAAPLGAEGLFLAILVGLVTVEISRFLTFLPKEGSESSAGVPPAVVHAFASFLPMLACVSLMFLVRHLVGVDIYELIKEHTSELKRLGDSFQAVFVVNVLLHLFGVAGVHGISVINAAMLPIWTEFVVANAEAHRAGEAMPYITAYPFYQWFIWVGGAGATFAANLRCLRSRNAHVKKIGRVSLIPGLFNVNEPLIFGLPVVANPILAIPFIVAPLVCGTIAYYATALGFVGKAFLEVPWVMPCFLGAVLSTQDKMAFVLLLVNLVVSYMIWSPFISTYEHRLEMEAEREGETLPEEPN